MTDPSADLNFSVVIAGGGSAGLTMAARLREADPSLTIAIIEPSETHDYQPLWTLVGAGVFQKEATRRRTADYIARGVTWLRERVGSFAPEENLVVLGSGAKIRYEQLVVCLGIEMHWDGIPGLRESLGRGGVCSIYSWDSVDYTWQALREFQGGSAVFTYPRPPIRCGGAPQKITYLADDLFRRNGVRSKSKVVYVAPTASIFGVEKYRVALERVIARKQIETHFRRHLIEIRPDRKQAVFEHIDDGSRIELNYDLLHVVPPQRAPRVIATSTLAAESGWVDADRHTLQHRRYPQIFAVGDCGNYPTAKTGAAVRKQAPIAVDNLLALRAGKPLTGHYNGYSSCPLITGYGSLILAEFDYDNQPAETFPFDQAQERYSMYALKAYALPELYWNGMLRGRI